MHKACRASLRNYFLYLLTSKCSRHLECFQFQILCRIGRKIIQIELLYLPVSSFFVQWRRRHWTKKKKNCLSSLLTPLVSRILELAFHRIHWNDFSYNYSYGVKLFCWKVTAHAIASDIKMSRLLLIEKWREITYHVITLEDEFTLIKGRIPPNHSYNCPPGCFLHHFLSLGVLREHCATTLHPKYRPGDRFDHRYS